MIKEKLYRGVRVIIAFYVDGKKTNGDDMNGSVLHGVKYILAANLGKSQKPIDSADKIE